MGKVYNIKLFKKEVEDNDNYQPMFNVFNSEIIYVPLMIESSDKPDADILEDEFLYVDCINQEKHIVLGLTSVGEQLVVPIGSLDIRIGNFVKGKQFSRMRMGEKMKEVKSFSIVDCKIAIPYFKTQLGVVDRVNQVKGLFHFVLESTDDGLVHFTETVLRPVEGDILEFTVTRKKDKQR